jgi:hypothetical protein
VELTPENFNQYLKEEGLDAVAAMRAKRNETGAKAHEIFSRCAKSLLFSGTPADNQSDRALGFTLELIAKKNPYALHAGEDLPVDLMYQGHPLAGVEILGQGSDDYPPGYSLTFSDAEGNFTLPGIEFEHYKAVAQDSQDVVQSVEIKDGGGLDLAYEASYAEEPAEGKQTVRVTTRARAKLAALLEPFLVPGVFESFLLLDETGKVLLAVPTDLQVRQLPPSAPPEGKGSGSGDKPSAMSPAEATRLPWIKDRDIGGRAYRVFAEPLDLGPTGSIKVAAICGLVLQSRFEADTVALNPYWLVALTALLVLAWLAWPVLKVTCMGPTERVRVFDLVFLGFSLLLGASLLTLISLDVAGYLAEREPMVVGKDAASLAAAAHQASAEYCARRDRSLPRFGGDGRTHWIAHPQEPAATPAGCCGCSLASGSASR